MILVCISLLLGNIQTYWICSTGATNLEYDKLIKELNEGSDAIGSRESKDAGAICDKRLTLDERKALQAFDALQARSEPKNCNGGSKDGVVVEVLKLLPFCTVMVIFRLQTNERAQFEQKRFDLHVTDS